MWSLRNANTQYHGAKGKSLSSSVSVSAACSVITCSLSGSLLHFVLKTVKILRNMYYDGVKVVKSIFAANQLYPLSTSTSRAPHTRTRTGQRGTRIRLWHASCVLPLHADTWVVVVVTMVVVLMVIAKIVMVALVLICGGGGDGSDA